MGNTWRGVEIITKTGEKDQGVIGVSYENNFSTNRVLLEKLHVFQTRGKLHIPLKVIAIP